MIQASTALSNTLLSKWKSRGWPKTFRPACKIDYVSALTRTVSRRGSRSSLLWQQRLWHQPIGMLVKVKATSRRYWLAIGSAVLLLTAVLVLASPWYIPWFVWTERRTPYVLDTHTPYYAVAKDANFTVPKIIHQTWKNTQIPEQWQAARQTCIDLHPDYEYKLWTDASSEAFIELHYPKLAATYKNYPYVIQRADAIRYAILHHYGGLYIDLDIVCLHPLDFLRTYGFIMPRTWPVGFSNDFLASAPGHPFTQQLIDRLPSSSWNMFSKYATVMFSTGPMFVTAEATAYRKTQAYRKRHDSAVLPDFMYGKYDPTAPDPLFEHLHGSSWHGDDAKSVLWFLKHPLVVVIGVVMAAAILVAQLVSARVRSTRLSAVEAENPLNKIC